jgi:hypothetical protein
MYGIKLKRIEIILRELRVYIITASTTSALSIILEILQSPALTSWVTYV